MSVFSSPQPKLSLLEPQLHQRGERGQHHEHGQQAGRVGEIQAEDVAAALAALLGEATGSSGRCTGSTHGMRLRINPPRMP